MFVNKVDLELRERAARVIPNGMYGHQSTAIMPQDFPQFFSRAQGTRLWDVDGNEYIDFMCAYGVNLLGYDHPAIRQAITDQMGLGDTMTGPTALIVELAETMVGMISHADWAMFCKNGSDATSMALVTARAYKDRRKVLVARKAYHGSQTWCTPQPAGILPEDRAHIVYFDYNDVESLRDTAHQAEGDLAGIFATPFRHNAFHDQNPPDAEFARAARAICDEHDALLIVDDIRAGFRLSRDCSWSTIGIEPDLSCWGKVLGNGQPISAMLGSQKARKAAESIFVTGSFWYSAVPMAAALATLHEIRNSNYLEHIETIGKQFRQGIQKQATDYDFEVHHTGPATLPMVLFADDPEYKIGYEWCRIAMKHGAYLSPYHNMFINAAMTKTDIELALTATDAAFEEIAQQRKNTGGNRIFQREGT